MFQGGVDTVIVPLYPMYLIGFAGHSFTLTVLIYKAPVCSVIIGSEQSHTAYFLAATSLKMLLHNNLSAAPHS